MVPASIPAQPGVVVLICGLCGRLNFNKLSRASFRLYLPVMRSRLTALVSPGVLVCSNDSSDWVVALPDGFFRFRQIGWCAAPPPCCSRRFRYVPSLSWFDTFLLSVGPLHYRPYPRRRARSAICVFFAHPAAGRTLHTHTLCSIASVFFFCFLFLFSFFSLSKQ